MGGPGKTEKKQSALADQQAAQGAQYAAMAQKSLGTMDTLNAPGIAADTNLINAANKGDYSQLIQSAGPEVGVVNQQFKQAQGQILNSTPAGAGRDAIMGSLPIQEASATASTLNHSYEGALKNLQQIAASYGASGLQLAGAGISSSNSAGSSLQAVGSEQAQGKADTMAMIGSITGSAATVGAAGL